MQLIALCNVLLLITIQFYITAAATPSEEFEEWFFKSSPLGKFINVQNMQDEPFYGEIPNAKPQTTRSKEPDTLVPIVIVPSLIGSQLWATLDGSSPPHWYCDNNADSYSLFLNQQQFYPLVVNCWMYNMQLEFDPSDGSYSSPKGVTVSEKDYGGVDGIEYLDTEHKVPVWNQVVEQLVSNYSYQVGKNLRAAPYDWRVGPNVYADQFESLKSLIEETYEMNNHTVALVSLSMGGPYTALFLNYVDQAWKDQYIYSWTSFSGPFGGSSWAIESLVNNYPGMPEWIDTASLRLVLQSFGSIVWLLPTEEVFGNLTFVYGPKANYTASDFYQLLQDAEATVSSQIYPEVIKYATFDPPGVPTNCFMGYGVSTPETYTFEGSFTGNYTATWNDGDSTVLTPSLAVCSEWANMQTQPVETYRIFNMTHAAEVRIPAVYELWFKTLGLPVEN